MRLAPIEKPPTLRARLMSQATRRMLGREITPAQVVYNRVPRAWKLSMALVRFDMGTRLDLELSLLVKAYVSRLNGCEFCEDIARAFAVRRRLGVERFAALEDPERSPALSERERAALAYAREAIALEVRDETFERLRACFTEEQIAELTLAISIEQFYNTMNRALEIPSDRLEELAREAPGKVRVAVSSP